MLTIGKNTKSLEDEMLRRLNAEHKELSKVIFILV